MTKKINLKAYTYPARNLNYSAGDILKKMRQNQELARIKQANGLVTLGVMEATQVEGGYGWAISDYIPFAFAYVSRPIFTSGLDGTAGIDFSALGDNMYTQALPTSLSELTAEDYQPAIFIPRVIHWHIEDKIFFGCYLLVCQVNSECTETDKVVRIHYRFEGKGYVAS